MKARSKSIKINSGASMNSMDLKHTKNRIIYWVMFAIMALASLICVLPILWVLLSCFKGATELLQIPPTIFPETWDFGKLAEIWSELEFVKAYKNSLIIAAGCVVSSTFVNGFAGYCASWLRPRGIGVFLYILFWTMLLPNTLSIVPLFKNMISLPILGLNLSNTFWPMWICAGAGAYTIFLFKNFFDSIPRELGEAARVDGCTRLGIFFRIILPLSKPIVAVNAIFTVTAAWNDFLLPFLMLSDTDLQPVMVKVFRMSDAMRYASLDEKLCAIVFSILPPIVIFCFLQKHIVGGLRAGGIKG